MSISYIGTSLSDSFPILKKIEEKHNWIITEINFPHPWFYKTGEFLIIGFTANGGDIKYSCKGSEIFFRDFPEASGL